MKVVYVIKAQRGNLELCDVNEEMKSPITKYKPSFTLCSRHPAALLFFVLFGVESYFRRFGSSRQDNLTHVSRV